MLGSSNTTECKLESTVKVASAQKKKNSSAGSTWTLKSSLKEGAKTCVHKGCVKDVSKMLLRVTDF